MNYILVLLAVVAVVIAHSCPQDVYDELVALKQAGEIDWDFVAPEETHSISDRSLYSLISQQLPSMEANYPIDTTPIRSTPATFHVSEKWPLAGTPATILNQGACGSCWAAGATGALADRVVVATGKYNMLSPQRLVSCDKLSFGCNGGNVRLTWTALETISLYTEQCMRYFSGDAGVQGECVTTCDDGSAPSKEYGVKFWSSKSYIGEEKMKDAVYNDGSIETGFTVNADFMCYKSGVYTPTNGPAASKALGGHAIRLVGWEENAWIIANSWGNAWGENGFFRVAFNSGLGFEAMAAAGTPKIN